VTATTPNQGPTAGVTVVTLTGGNFKGTTAITFWSRRDGGGDYGLTPTGPEAFNVFNWAMLPAAMRFEVLVTAWSSADAGALTAGPDSDPWQETPQEAKAADTVFTMLGALAGDAAPMSQSIEDCLQLNCTTKRSSVGAA
jgi:hypothetical protein